MPNDAEIVIAGGGAAGLALALALKQGLGPRGLDHRGRSGAGRDGRGRRRPRLGVRRRRAPHAGGAGGVAAPRRRGAADPRHGGDRQPHPRRGAADAAHLRRRRGARRAVRPHDREPHRARRAGGGLPRRRRGRWCRPRCCAPPTTSAATASVAEFADGRSIAAHLVAAADGGRSHLRERAGIATTRATMASPASSPRWAWSSTTTAAPRSISCPPGRSPSCRSPGGGPRSCGPSTRDAAERYCRLEPELFLDEVTRRLGHQYRRVDAD